MPLKNLLTKPTLFFLGLNVIRLLSIVAICLTLAGELYTMVVDIQGYQHTNSAAASASATPATTASTKITRQRRAFVAHAVPSPSFVALSSSSALAQPTAAPANSHSVERMVKLHRRERVSSTDSEAESSTTTNRRATSTSSSFSTALPTATNEPLSASVQSANGTTCAYVGNTSVPRTTGGVVFSTLERIFAVFLLLLSLLSELPLPPLLFLHVSHFWTYAFPPFGPEFGTSVLGLVEVFLAAGVLSKAIAGWVQVSGWLLFLVGIFNLLAGLAFGHRGKTIRSFSADSTSPSALRKLRLASSTSVATHTQPEMAEEKPYSHYYTTSSPSVSNYSQDPRQAQQQLPIADQYQHHHQHSEGEYAEGPSFRPARRTPSPSPSPSSAPVVGIMKRSASRNGPNGIVISPPRPLRPSQAFEKEEMEDVGAGGSGRGALGARETVSPPPPIYFPGGR
ncbi:hypothetical protein JCM8097_004761 [Rhodosporidiobolus ruineniae]